MSTLLSIETSAARYSVALYDSNARHMLAYLEELAPHQAAAMLASHIDELLSHQKNRKPDGIVVAEGPGSYTGLRIGVAMAKGLCYAWDVPLVAVNTLALMACQVKGLVPSQSWRCPMIDARRMEVYCAIFDQDDRQIQPARATVIDEKSFADAMAVRSIYFFGDGAQKCQGVLTHANAHYLPDIYPSAKTLAMMGAEKYQRKEFVELASFEPFYLKDFLIKKPSLSH